jgi:hypothetical protein
MILGSCGSGEAEIDSDSDCFSDRIDECPQDCEKKAPVVFGCDGVDRDLDFDNDGVPDCHDGFPNIIDKTVLGLRGCGEVNTDSDSDEVLDCEDECPPRHCKDSRRQMWMWRSRNIFRR